MVNVYEVFGERIDYWGDERCFESFSTWELICADTRGQARQIFADLYSLEFIDPMHIHIKAKNVEHQSGVVHYSDPLFNEIFPEIETEISWMEWDK